MPAVHCCKVVEQYGDGLYWDWIGLPFWSCGDFDFCLSWQCCPTGLFSSDVSQRPLYFGSKDSNDFKRLQNVCSLFLLLFFFLQFILVVDLPQ